MTSKLRVLLSGPGLMGRKHIALLRENSDVHLAAIVAPERSAGVGFAAGLGVRCFSSVQEAIDSEKIDAAIISSPNPFHYKQAMPCIENGIPTLVEKPLTDSLETARAVVAAADERKVSVLVGHHRRYNPLLEIARRFLTSEKFGDPVCVLGSALFYKPAAYFASAPWRTRLGGGPMLINMIHEVANWRFLVGEIESVTAKLSSHARKFEVEDSAAMTFTFMNGAIGAFLLSDASASSKSWEMTAGENPAYPHFPEQNCYHFSGSMGSLDFPSMRFRTYLGKPTRSWWEPFLEGQIPIEHQDPFANQLRHFVDVVRGNAAPIESAAEGYRNMLVVEALVQAARTGREVRISELAG